MLAAGYADTASVDLKSVEIGVAECPHHATDFALRKDLPSIRYTSGP